MSTLSRQWSERTDIEDLSGRSLTTLCVVGLLAGWVWLYAVAGPSPDFVRDGAQAGLLGPPLLLLVACGAALVLNRLPLVSRSTLLLLGLGGALLLSHVWVSSDISLYCLALTVLMAGLLVGAEATFVVALILTVSLWALGRLGAISHPAGKAVPAVVLLWASALVSWLSSRNLYTALRWALHSQRQARRLLEELRERQGELNRTLEALTEASRRLERTNQELAIARQRADEARATKEHFVANVSHELRTPLNLIVGFSEMMYLEPESYDGVGWTSDLQSDIGELYRASQHLQSLVNDILDLSRINVSRLPMLRELADLRPVIRAALDTMAPLLEKHGLSLTAEWPDDLPPVLVDRTRIRQVMLNLLCNALRFTERGGITVRIVRERDALVVSVADTGVGVSPDKLEEVFEAFQQLDSGLRRREGAGLGLALGRQFVELHGGRMWAESEVGKGSTFYFALPLPGTTPQSGPLLLTPERPRTDDSNAPVVLVDPDASVADMLSRYLGDRRVLAARDAQEAEELILAEHPAGVIVNQPPDAPLAQWLDTVGQASERYSVPVVHCSIPSATWLKQSTGLDDCLSKPASRQALRTVLQRYCHRSSTILVVDDNPGFVNLMARMIGAEALAGRILTAYSGPEGLRLAREEVPDLVLLDLLMPVLDGFAVLRTIREDPRLAGTRVVAITASSYPEDLLLRQGGRFTMVRPSGIATGSLAELLNAAFQHVRPDYVEPSTLPST